MTKLCKVCGTSFVPYKPNRHACYSKACSDKYWRSSNLDIKKEYDKNYYRRNAHKWVASGLKTKYGITSQQYWHLMIQQEGRCAICGTHEPSKSGIKTRMCVDHNHKTKEVRGLLCESCNRGLGLLKDSSFYIESFV